MGLAAAAFERGDEFFQVDLSISALSTRQSNPFGVKITKLRKSDTAPGDVLGLIEALGWRLEHAGWVFVEVASRTASSNTSVNRGVLKGVYLFRRAEPAT